jgi:hypothetical protein
MSAALVAPTARATRATDTPATAAAASAGLTRAVLRSALRTVPITELWVGAQTVSVGTTAECAAVIELLDTTSDAHALMCNEVMDAPDPW